MKRITKRIISALSVCAMFTASLPISVSAAAENVQPRGSYHVYGDVNNDGIITGSDATLALHAYKVFENLTGSSDLPVEYAVARPSVYFGNIETPVPQAADTNCDGVINNDDATDILHYYTLLSSGSSSLEGYNGNCGKVFFIQ